MNMLLKWEPGNPGARASTFHRSEPSRASRQYIHPPVSGAYVFWVASDDTSELRLSTDEDPAHARPIASSPQWTSPREYTKFPVQQSQPIELKAGRRYYVEALQKPGGGGDHLSVAWRLPNGTEEKPIPGSRLSPWVRK